MSEAAHTERKTLRLATCGKCKAKSWLPEEHGGLNPIPCAKCGHPVILPVQVRHFELREVIASGGMGTVYRAYDNSLHRVVAFKMLKREMVEDKQVMESLFREARAMASLNHPHILHIYSFDEHEGSPYIVMELADRGSLDNWIERDGLMPELAMLDLGVKVTSALESAVQRNLLHRDIKPGNILFDDYGEPKLVDFGLARAAENSNEYEAEIFGTPYYVAPEKIHRRGEDFRSDMYSLGGTLYHALTGHVPFEAETIEGVLTAHLHTPLTPPNLVRPEISQATSDAIATAMAKDPEHRFQSYGEFKMALESSRSFLLVEELQRQQEPPPDEGQPAPAQTSWWRKR